MVQTVYKTLRSFGLLAVALHLAACGVISNSSSTTPPSSPEGGKSGIASGPFLDAWWDARIGGMRTVYGVPGAAYEAAPTYTDGPYTNAKVCMRKSIALLTTSAGALFSVSLPQGSPTMLASHGIANPLIVFSPSCTLALAYAPGNSSALMLQGLLATPSVSALRLPDGVSTAVIADSGSVLLSLPGQAGSAAIQLLPVGGSTARAVTVLSKFGGMAFVPGVDSALLADSAANIVVEASHLTGSASLTEVASEANGVSKPVAVGVSSDGRFGAVVNSDGATVLRLDLTGQTAPAQVSCHCSPTELEPLAGNLVFRLNEAGAGTVWAFNGDASTPRVLFIPTSQVATAAKGAQR
jgi:hypothetical protein